MIRLILKKITHFYSHQSTILYHFLRLPPAISIRSLGLVSLMTTHPYFYKCFALCQFLPNFRVYLFDYIGKLNSFLIYKSFCHN